MAQVSARPQRNSKRWSRHSMRRKGNTNYICAFQNSNCYRNVSLWFDLIKVPTSIQTTQMAKLQLARCTGTTHIQRAISTVSQRIRAQKNKMENMLKLRLIRKALLFLRPTGGNKSTCSTRVQRLLDSINSRIQSKQSKWLHCLIAAGSTWTEVSTNLQVLRWAETLLSSNKMETTQKWSKNNQHQILCQSTRYSLSSSSYTSTHWKTECLCNLKWSTDRLWSRPLQRSKSRRWTSGWHRRGRL